MKCDNSERDCAVSHFFAGAKEPFLDDYLSGRCFGYRKVPVEDPSKLTGFGRSRIVAVKLEIDPHEASIVRNIFSLFGSGHSMAEIARLLNAGGALGHRVGINSPRSTWNRDSIRRILRNSRYCGRLTWNKTRKRREPETVRVIAMKRSPHEWVTREIPELQIITKEDFDRAQNNMGRT